MKKRIFLTLMLITVLLIPVFSFAYEDVNILDWEPYAYETIVVSTTSISRPFVTYRNNAGALFLTVETNNIRYRIDSGNPSATLGHLVVSSIYQNFWINNRVAIQNLRMIAVGGNATVRITYYRRQ